MRKGYHEDMTPFDMARKPSKQYFFLMPLIWSAAFLLTRSLKLKIRKENMKGVKPPYLVIATHQGPVDYYIAPLAFFPHRAIYVSDMEGFANYGKWLYRGLGCIGKRRFVSDVTVVKNMRYAAEIGQSVVVYPESRHSNVGTTAYIPKNMGKLCKFMKLPLVLLTVKGGYLANPFWDEAHTRKVPVEARLKCVCSKEEVEKHTESELQKIIEEGLKYNEYRYQQERGIRICEPRRAEGLHKPLYQCRHCGSRYRMQSHDEILECTACGSAYDLTEEGFLREKKNGERIEIPEWYEWERKQAIEAFAGERHYEVRIEALPNEKGFVNLGKGELLLNETEFRLSFGTQTLYFPHRIRESVQTEYDYQGKGEAIVLSTKDCCYYLYSEAADFNPTELQFIGEWLHQKDDKMQLQNAK